MSQNKSKNIFIFGVIVVAIIIVSSLVYNNLDNSKFSEKFDMDSDGIVDALDAFDEDPAEWADFDFDGIGSNADLDDDNDHILDENDETPVTVSKILTEKYLNQIQKCSVIGLSESPQICFANFFEYIIKEGESGQDVLELAMSLFSIGLLNGCHVVTHQIGTLTYENNPEYIENILDRPLITCRGGFIHGSMKAFFLDLKEQGFKLTDFDDVCNDLISSRYNFRICLHGVGHGLFEYYDRNLDSALNDCVTYPHEVSCHNGAIMEYVEQKITDSSTLGSEVSEICSKKNMDLDDFEYCSIQIGKLLAYFNNNDQKIVSRYCEMIKDPEGKDYCNEGLEKAVYLAEYDRNEYLNKFRSFSE